MGERRLDKETIADWAAHDSGLPLEDLAREYLALERELADIDAAYDDLTETVRKMTATEEELIAERDQLAARVGELEGYVKRARDTLENLSISVATAADTAIVILNAALARTGPGQGSDSSGEEIE